MQKYISTNVQIPQDLWKEVKIKGAKEGKTMKALVLEGLNYVMGQNQCSKDQESAKELLLKYSGKETSPLTDGSVEHDKYIYDK